jgi:hypothetical protein
MIEKTTMKLGQCRRRLGVHASGRGVDPANETGRHRRRRGRTDQGFSVALAGDGNTAIVGGPLDNSFVGAAWVFAFAGTPGTASCYGQSVSALVREFGGLNNAAAALGVPSIRALQNAILAVCGGWRFGTVRLLLGLRAVSGLPAARRGHRGST